jgi:putative ABC transport system substrate-binding protein
MTSRRDFITLLGGAAASWPLAARAQRPGVPVIGYLSSGSPDISVNKESANRLADFREGLKEAGFVEGQNVAIEYRYAEGRNDRLPGLAADLVRRQVTMIFCAATPATIAAKAATATIPIVFVMGTDPVDAGLVASLNRPSGNVTGATSLNVEVGPKRLELIHELVPAARIIGLLVNPTNPSSVEIEPRELQTPARALGLELHTLGVTSAGEIDQAFKRLVELRAGALAMGPDSFLSNHSEQIAALALRNSTPAISAYREFPAVGGLMSYGGKLADSWRQGGVYTGRILKGEKPADLPVQQGTKVELVINLKTAKALGLSVPPSLLAIAEEAIE